MAGELKGKRVAILVTKGFEQIELTDPRQALDQAGAKTVIVAPDEGKVRGWNFTEWGEEFRVDAPLDSANPADYDALLLPGGVMNPDYLRINPAAVKFCKAFFDAHKPVASICHGPWLLVEANVVRGRKLTSWLSIRTDIVNAGGDWRDEEVVVDNGLVTSRKPDDLPAFNRKMIEEFAEGLHERRKAS
ncbi:MAG: type 1 glutamine amidotransferase [Bryobacteraceae bacterium]|nr:type 1 glutamine amidotransferase [Bryobacteraceae bacterium]